MSETSVRCPVGREQEVLNTFMPAVASSRPVRPRLRSISRAGAQLVRRCAVAESSGCRCISCLLPFLVDRAPEEGSIGRATRRESTANYCRLGTSAAVAGALKNRSGGYYVPA